MTTENKISQLRAWKQYRVLLSGVDAGEAPEIIWPDKNITSA
ncbi:tail fiber assembly protein [Citrobacter enshiensis]